MAHCPEILPGLPSVWKGDASFGSQGLVVQRRAHFAEASAKGSGHHSPGLNPLCVKFCALNLLLYPVNKY